MTFSTGALKTHFIIQTIVPLPFLVNLDKRSLKKNRLNSINFVYLLFSEISVIFVVLPIKLNWVSIRLVHLAWLVVHWTSYTLCNVDEFIVYGLFTFSILFYLHVCVVFQAESNSIMTLLNSTCQLYSQLQHHRLKKIKLAEALPERISIKPIFAYCLAIAFVISVLTFAEAPFTFSYPQLNLVFWSNWIIKALSALWYGLITAYSVVSVLAVLLATIIFCEHNKTYAKI